MKNTPRPLGVKIKLYSVLPGACKRGHQVFHEPPSKNPEIGNF
jgi:hypothetical protein